jgi:hypothetical protein
MARANTFSALMTGLFIGLKAARDFSIRIRFSQRKNN